MDEYERTERQMAELLQELRVALPGVQILFAFLLIVPFAARFDTVTTFQRTAFFIALIATAASTVCLIAVPATHRLRFRRRDRVYIVRVSNTYLIAGLVLLGVAMIAALVFLTDFLYGGAATWIWPGLIAIALVLLWFVRPTLRGRSSKP